MSATRVILDPKRVAGHIFPSFDFQAQMDAGDTLTGPTVLVTVWSGVDVNPSVVWDATTIISGSIVKPGLQAGLAGVIYLVRVTAAAGSKVLVLEGLLAILPEGM